MNWIQSAFGRRLRQPDLPRAGSDDARQSRGTAREPVLPLVPDNSRLVEMLTQVMGQPASVVMGRLRHEHHQFGWNVTDELPRRHLQPFCRSEGAPEFCRETEAIRFEV